MFYFMNRIDWQWRRCKVLTRIFSTWGYDIAWTTFNPSVCRRLEVRYSCLVLTFMLHHLAWWNIRSGAGSVIYLRRSRYLFLS